MDWTKRKTLFLNNNTRHSFWVRFEVGYRIIKKLIKIFMIIILSLSLLIGFFALGFFESNWWSTELPSLAGPKQNFRLAIA